MCRFVTLLLLAAATLPSGCAARAGGAGPVPRPFPSPGAPSSPVPESGATGEEFGAPTVLDGYAIAGTALSLRGIRYVAGGSDPSGFDCSGLVSYVYAQHGLAIPRTVAEQFRSGEPVEDDRVEAGDLVFFNTKGAGATHVGIAIGGEEFIHAPTANGQVRVERLGAAYWRPRFVGARRVTPRGAVPCASGDGRSCQ